MDAANPAPTWEKSGVTLISDPALIFTVMVTATLVVPLFAAKLRVPDVVMLLFAGTLLGPQGLGLLERNSAIMLFGSVGLLYIMFLAGLEIDLPLFIQSRRRSLLFGLLTFAIPLGLGVMTGRILFSMGWLESMLLACIFAPHMLLAYPTASRLGIARTEPVAVAVGATLVADILVLVVLAVVLDSARGMELTALFWLHILGGLAALIAAGWWGIPWLSRWFFRNNGENGNAQFLFVLGVLCVFSYASHYARMEPIIGAFLAGIAFNRMIPRQSTLMNRVEFVGKTIFIPFFLISVGMLVDVQKLVREPQGWLVAGIMVFGVIVSKYAAAHAARRILGYTREEGHVMFGLSVVHVALALAVALLGFDLGILSAEVLNGSIAVILVTCPLGSWVVDRYGRQMGVQRPAGEAPRRTEQRLLVPVVNPATATKLLDLAFVLRDKTRQGVIHPITIISDEEDTTESLAESEKLIAHCLAHAASAEIPVTPTMRISLNASDGLIRAAREIRASLVMLGWGEDKTVVTRIFGSVRTRMLQECAARLLFCRLVQPLNTVRRLLLPLPPLADRRDDIEELVRDAKGLAGQLGVRLHAYLSDPAAAGRLRALIDKTLPEVPAVITEMPDWVSARERMLKEVIEDDMAILPVERRLGAFWRPSLDRLPDFMAARFPRMNLLVAYPALAGSYEPVPCEPEEVVAGLGRIVPVPMNDAGDLNAVLCRLASGLGAAGGHDRQHLVELLSASAAAYPVELATGTVLLHAHSNIVDTPTLLVGAGETGLTLPGTDVPARVILALVSPHENSPEQHLAALSHLARMYRDQAFAASVSGTNSAEEIAGLLREAAQNPGAEAFTRA